MTQHETFRIFSLGTNIYILEQFEKNRVKIDWEKFEKEQEEKKKKEEDLGLNKEGELRSGENGRDAIFDCIHRMLPAHVHFFQSLRSIRLFSIHSHFRW